MPVHTRRMDTGEPVHVTKSVRRVTPRVRFKILPMDATLAVTAVTAREVYVDGVLTGWLYGVDPSPYNEHRPTAFRYVPRDGGNPTLYDRLEPARDGIERLHPQTPTEPVVHPEVAASADACKACQVPLAAAEGADSAESRSRADVIDVHAAAAHDDHVCVVRGEAHDMLCPGVKCWTCHGAGEVPTVISGDGPDRPGVSLCPRCQGSGAA